MKLKNAINYLNNKCKLLLSLMSKYLKSIDLCEEIELNCPQKYKLQGYSKAGFQTGYWLSTLNIMLDCGVYTCKQPRAIFITHSHADHSFLLPYIITCRSNMTPIYMPSKSYLPIQNHLNSIRCLASSSEENNGENVWAIQKCIPHQMVIDTEMKPPELKNIIVKPLKCYHTCESIGFGFSTFVMKLKQYYSKIEKSELIKLKSEGIEVLEEIKTPQFVFFGDTNIDALLLHDEWKNYPVIIIECTGYDNMFDISNVDNIIIQKNNSQYERGHIHINDIVPVMLSNLDKQYILIHSGGAFDEIKLSEIELLLKTKLKINVIISK